MERIGRFEKVPFGKFYESVKDLYNLYKIEQKDVLKLFEDLKLPERATTGSAGYDFYLPFDIFIPAHHTMLFPTGIRVFMEDGWVLQIYTKSSLGMKHGIILTNSVSIIDNDYYYSDNAGQIRASLTNTTDHDVSLKAGQPYMQGVFSKFGITYGDNVTNVRNGGLGSTYKW